MKLPFLAAGLLVLTACEQEPAPPPPPPPAEEKDSVEFKLDTEEGAGEFKKEGEEGDDVNVEVKDKE